MAKAKRVSTKARNSSPTTSKAIRVRMYRHGLGDCFLLSFPKEKPGQQCHVLIDCGLITVAKEPKQTMETVVNDVATVTKGELDLVVMTHEHWDHVSGFSPQQAQGIFDGIKTIKQVWYAWTENPDNKLGRQLRHEREAKAKAVQTAAIKLSAANSKRGEQLGSLLGFLGIDTADLVAAKANGIGKVREAFMYMSTRAPIRYCHPQNGPQPLSDVPGVLVYVLGPPEDEAMIKKMNPTKTGKEVYELAALTNREENIMAALSRLDESSDSVASDSDYPFAVSERRDPQSHPSSSLLRLKSKTWDVPAEEWRRIEHDWMMGAEDLAIALDSHTNNSCLVLAFELIDSGRVLLFAADAQVGNWLSWQDLKWEVRNGTETRVVTGPDLLRRTVLYKVGHHGSHNATLREKGLEQMVHPDLMALIPVNKWQAETNRWFGMPFKALTDRLEEKTNGRVVVSDSEQSISANARTAFGASLNENKLYYDLFVPM
ncbi:MAG: hypothetical protein H8K03_12210 [Nitrospira sp.]